jgi:hypothetical protein
MEAKSGERQTVRWRELDSKFQFRATVRGSPRYAIRAEERVTSAFVSPHCRRERIQTPVDRLRFQGFVICLLERLEASQATERPGRQTRLG